MPLRDEFESRCPTYLDEVFGFRVGVSVVGWVPQWMM